MVTGSAFVAAEREPELLLRPGRVLTGQSAVPSTRRSPLATSQPAPRRIVRHVRVNSVADVMREQQWSAMLHGGGF